MLYKASIPAPAPSQERPDFLEFRGKQYTKDDIIDLAKEARAAFSKAVVLRAISTGVFTVEELRKHVRTISKELLAEWREDAEVSQVLKGPAPLCLKDPAVDKMFRPMKKARL